MPRPFRALFILLIGFIFTNCKEVKEEKTITAVVETAKTETSLKPLYEDLSGNTVALKAYKGKRVLLNYWATWCAPCIEEMPDLLALQEVLKEENYVFLLASDQSTKKIKAFKDAKGFDFKFIKFNGSYPEHNISALPVTLIFNEVGEQVIRFDGMTAWNTPQMIEQLKNIQ